VRAVSRRTALGAFAGTLLATAGMTGCGTAQPPRNVVAGGQEEDADTLLLRSVVDEIDSVVALLEAVRRRERSLRPRVDRLLRVHAAHRELLASAVDSPAPPAATRRTRAPRGREAAATEVTRREERLAARVATAAVDAESGTFARVLASMSAGLRQQLEVA
jgi:hypothetical protein